MTKWKLISVLWLFLKRDWPRFPRNVFIFIFQSNPFAAKLQTEDLEERLAEEKTKLAALEPEVGQGYIFGTNPPLLPPPGLWGGGIKNVHLIHFGSKFNFKFAQGKIFF